MKLTTAGQMQQVDRYAIETMGVSGSELMENAGREVAEFIRDLFDDDIQEKKLAIFCGKGNNGGDGFVIARYLHRWDAEVTVFLLAGADDYEGDALANLRKLEPLDLKRIVIGESDSYPGLSECDMIVDAIFGTGFRGSIREPIASLVKHINESEIPVVAVDTPSGLDNDSGEVTGLCIEADFTASLALPKIGQFFYPGRSYCGEITVIDIGMPDKAIASVTLPLNLITEEMVAERIPDREPTVHKGDCGKLFILAGSVGMTGAAVLAAESAVKSGAGLVYVGLPESLNDIVEVKLTEALTRPLPELRKRRCLPLRALGQILDNLKGADAACLGPGVGRHFETVELFQRLIRKLKKPALLDADGLFPFNAKPELLRECHADLVLTPHLGEFARLTGKNISEIKSDPLVALQQYVAEVDKVVLLKGAPTLIAAPGGDVFLSPGGNPGMATGGSGDVLSGVIGSLLALGLPAVDAAICGAYIHAAAGDLAKDAVGIFGLTASDIARFLPEIFRQIAE